MWLIIPLVYFLGWWQTRSLRQALNGTIAWIIGYALAAGTILMLDVGGYDFVRATPDSPGAALAILGGFVGMWISNILWRRRGGDPPRQPGKWERAFQAMMGKEKKKKKPRPKSPSPQLPPPAHRQPAGPTPVEAQYRPAHQSQATQPPTTPHSRPMQQAAGPRNGQQFAQQAPQQQPPRGPHSSKKKRKNSPTADKYARATGRALGAMFRGSGKKQR